jgi:hypothetical protein
VAISSLLRAYAWAAEVGVGGYCRPPALDSRSLFSAMSPSGVVVGNGPRSSPACHWHEPFARWRQRLPAAIPMPRPAEGGVLGPELAAGTPAPRGLFFSAAGPPRGGMAFVR